MHFWDLRTSKSFDTVLGPSVSGDAIDYKNGIVIVGSHRNKNYLEAYDFGKREKIQNISWEGDYNVDGAYVNFLSSKNFDKCSRYLRSPFTIFLFNIDFQ